MMSFGQVLLSYVERKRSASANLELYNSSLEHICSNRNIKMTCWWQCSSFLKINSFFLFGAIHLLCNSVT